MQVTKRRNTKTTKATQFPRSACAIASTLDIVGDKWSLLVVRDLLHGKMTYGELLNSPERIPTNILADRLRRLEAVGILLKSAYQERPVRYAYSLTTKGAELGNILFALGRWGAKHIPGTMTYGASASRSQPKRSAR